MPKWPPMRMIFWYTSFDISKSNKSYLSLNSVYLYRIYTAWMISIDKYSNYRYKKKKVWYLKMTNVNLWEVVEVIRFWPQAAGGQSPMMITHWIDNNLLGSVKIPIGFWTSDGTGRKRWFRYRFFPDTFFSHHILESLPSSYNPSPFIKIKGYHSHPYPCFWDLRCAVLLIVMSWAKMCRSLIGF